MQKCYGKLTRVIVYLNHRIVHLLSMQSCVNVGMLIRKIVHRLVPYSIDLKMNIQEKILNSATDPHFFQFLHSLEIRCFSISVWYISIFSPSMSARALSVPQKLLCLGAIWYKIRRKTQHRILVNRLRSNIFGNQFFFDCICFSLPLSLGNVRRQRNKNVNEIHARVFLTPFLYLIYL